jgi:hypothetical protein
LLPLDQKNHAAVTVPATAVESNNFALGAVDIAAECDTTLDCGIEPLQPTGRGPPGVPNRSTTVGISNSALALSDSNDVRPLGIGPNSPEFVRRKQAAEILRATYKVGSESILAHHASRNTGPRFYSMGARVSLYRISDLHRWATERLVERSASSTVET